MAETKDAVAVSVHSLKSWGAGMARSLTSSQVNLHFSPSSSSSYHGNARPFAFVPILLVGKALIPQFFQVFLCGSSPSLVPSDVVTTTPCDNHFHASRWRVPMVEERRGCPFRLDGARLPDLSQCAEQGKKRWRHDWQNGTIIHRCTDCPTGLEYVASTSLPIGACDERYSIDPDLCN